DFRLWTLRLYDLTSSSFSKFSKNLLGVSPVITLNKLANVLGCKSPYITANSLRVFFRSSLSVFKSDTACCIRKLLIYVLKPFLCSFKKAESVLREVFNFSAKSPKVNEAKYPFSCSKLFIPSHNRWSVADKTVVGSFG